MTTQHPASVERFMGFAEVYDRSRPQTPEVLGQILCQWARMDAPDLVVDLGCGTGLSTRYWAGRAAQVIGIDPSPDMLNYARAHTTSANVAYLHGYGHQTGLPSGCADILMASQALHWMEPEGTLAEIARLLRPGGVFAALDFDFPPILPRWEAESAYQAFLTQLEALDQQHHIDERVPSWPKAEHLKRMQACGLFRFTREFRLHHTELGDAERLVLGALSYGLVQSLLKTGVTEKELGVDALRADAERLLGKEPRLWYWSAQVRIGVI